jgi:hypothetical protein
MATLEGETRYIVLQADESIFQGELIQVALDGQYPFG